MMILKIEAMITVDGDGGFLNLVCCKDIDFPECIATGYWKEAKHIKIRLTAEQVREFNDFKWGMDHEYLKTFKTAFSNNAESDNPKEDL